MNDLKCCSCCELRWTNCEVHLYIFLKQNSIHFYTSSQDVCHISVNTEDFSSFKHHKAKINHACKILLSYYCSAHLFETLLRLTKKLE